METIFLIAVLFAFLPTVFWFLFYFKKIFISWQLISFTALKGMLLCLTVYLIEEKIIFYFLPHFKHYLFQFGSFAFNEIPLSFFLFVFFIITPLEEIPKFFILKRTIFKSKQINQIVDGLQLGIVLGLGFAACENFLHFSRALSLAPLSKVMLVFFLRFFISTLAHTLYTAGMGYYLALARFHKLYRKFLLERAFVIPIVLHGVFNFFFLSGMGWLSVIILAGLSLVLYKWYQDRKTFEFKLRQRTTPLFWPFLAEKKETDVYFTKEKVPFSFLKEIGIRPIKSNKPSMDSKQKQKKH